jgi:N-acetylmuramoyl-L-alanine amidase
MAVMAVLIWMYAGTPLSAQQAGIIQGKLPQLAPSTGEDRLGSAKYGYIDTGVVVHIADSLPGLYVLQMSAQKTCYISKDFVRLTADSLPLKPALAESWSCKGGPTYDTVSISLSRKVLYHSYMTTKPARIVLEIYNAQSNTNWITQLSTAKAVEEMSWRQTGADVVEVSIGLKHNQHLGYEIGYSGKRLQLLIRQKPDHPALKEMLVAIDAGHGGINMGARGSTTRMQEKELTLQYALAFEKLLQRHHIKTYMVRRSDTTIDNKDRLLQLQSIRPDVLISFHFNSSGRQEVRGVSTYYKHVAFRPLTLDILNQLLKIPDLQEFGNVGSFNFQLVQPIAYPSCLVEVAFLSNPLDERLIADEAFKKKVVQKVYEGLQRWAKQLD